MAFPVRSKAREEMETWEPFRELTALQKRMNRLFEELMPGPRLRLLPGLAGETVMPEMEIYETERGIVIKAHLPGVDKKDLDVSVDENSITIKGEMKQSKETEEGQYYRSEISYGTFSRTMSLPGQVEPGKAKAQLDNGVLEVRIPKTAAEKAKIKKVPVT